MDKAPAHSRSYFARTTFRNQRRIFGIKQADRLSHMYAIGRTGVGKSTLIETMVRQDMRAGRGVALLDPHGDLVDALLPLARKYRADDLIYFDAADRTNPLGFNPLESVPGPMRPLMASNLLEVFKKIWSEFWGPRLEHILRNALLALLDQPEARLSDILRMFEDDSFRRHVAGRVSHSHVRHFWLREFERYPARLRAEAVSPIQNKVSAFVSNPVLAGILEQTKSAFNLRDVMDRRRVLLVNLAKGRLGSDGASLLGSLLVARLGLAALGRADVPESQRVPFHVFIDEFQNFSTLALATMLSELRKYGVSLTLVHQHMAQLDPQIREAVLGNVGTVICFRVGASDAELLRKEFEPEFGEIDLVRLPNHNIYVKLMVDGAVTTPFSAETIRLGS